MVCAGFEIMNVMNPLRIFPCCHHDSPTHNYVIAIELRAGFFEFLVTLRTSPALQGAVL